MRRLRPALLHFGPNARPLLFTFFLLPLFALVARKGRHKVAHVVVAVAMVGTPHV